MLMDFSSVLGGLGPFLSMRLTAIERKVAVARSFLSSGSVSSSFQKAFSKLAWISISIKKWRGKFECLIYEMLLTRKKRPTLNAQKDSIPAKLTVH